MDLSWILEENKISTGCRRGAAFLRGPSAGPSGRVRAESRISATGAGDSSGGPGERERDEGHRWRSGRRQTRKGFEELLGGQWLILYLVGKWKPMEDWEQRDSMIRHMLQED